jgi:xylan 1,4-beta-xylosidase
VRAMPDVNAIATRSERRIDVMLWNYHDDDVVAPAAEIALAVDGVPAGKVHVERLLVDARHIDAYSVWQGMGSPERPTAQQFMELQRAAKLETVERTDSAVHDGHAGLDLKLERQGVMLVRLSW